MLKTSKCKYYTLTEINVQDFLKKDLTFSVVSHSPL